MVWRSASRFARAILTPNQFRVLCPRWDTSGGDIYGNSPGMEALGGVKQLQHEALRKSQGIDFQTAPPLQAPSSMKGRDVDFLPRGITFVDASTPAGGIKELYESRIRLDHLLADIQDVRSLVRESFHVDMMLMISSGSSNQRTAYEVAQLYEEKLLVLGPVVDRMQNEIQEPLIDITFTDMLAAGIVPTPPEELQGIELRVEFMGMFAQAQRAIAVGAVDKFVSSVGVVAQMKPGVLDKLDEDYWADATADALGVDPEMIVPGENVVLIRKQRAEAMQAQQQAALLNQGADTAKKLGSVDTGRQNALTDLMQSVGGA